MLKRRGGKKPIRNGTRKSIKKSFKDPKKKYTYRRYKRKPVESRFLPSLPPNQETNQEPTQEIGSKWSTLNDKTLIGIDSTNKKKKIEEALSESRGKIVYGYFWMEGCGFCTPLHPIWKEIVTEMKTKHPEYFDINFRREHVEEATSVLRDKCNLTENITVDGFPTIFIIRNGNIKYYEGERSKDHIIQWLTLS